MEYQHFLDNLDKKLAIYFEKYRDYIVCKKGCSMCCQTGDYPLSNLEFQYVIKGYISLDDEIKRVVQRNVQIFQKGGACPFLVDNLCSIYEYRPIVCRVHGLAYKGKRFVMMPFCTNNGKNFSDAYSGGEILIEPISENLDTPNILKDYDYGEIRTMYAWIKEER